MPHPLARELAERLAPATPAERLTPDEPAQRLTPDEPAQRLIPGDRVLLIGVGSGRNVPVLLAAGARVDALEEDPGRAREASARFAAEARVRVVRARYGGPYPFAGGHAAALSTHALQHGSLAGVGAAVAAIRSRLRPGGPFYLTLGSKRDPRFAAGRRLDADVSAPLEGAEAGVPHLYLDEAQVRTLLAGFEIESASEGSAAETAGRWAHTAAEAQGLIHWFVRARRAG